MSYSIFVKENKMALGSFTFNCPALFARTIRMANSETLAAQFVAKFRSVPTPTKGTCSCRPTGEKKKKEDHFLYNWTIEKIGTKHFC